MRLLYSAVACVSRAALAALGCRDNLTKGKGVRRARSCQLQTYEGLAALQGQRIRRELSPKTA